MAYPTSPVTTSDGSGDRDDEIINVDLAAAPPTITKIFFAVSIYDADNRRQTFGQVDDACIRVVDTVTRCGVSSI